MTRVSAFVSLLVLAMLTAPGLAAAPEKLLESAPARIEKYRKGNVRSSSSVEASSRSFTNCRAAI
jgi:hypothetical protein